MKFKKHLGQHFLKNQNIARKIVKAADVNKNDVILEVGPGRGALTGILLQKAKKVIAVEKDKELADFLTDKFKGQKNLSVINGDILRFNSKSYPPAMTPARLDFVRAKSGRSSGEVGRGKLKSKSYKIVANIPYYITSRFLRQFLETDYQPSLMVLMVQKEVAERIVAQDKKESLLSISVKAYAKPKIIAKVPAENFSPKPKVDSAIIALENISKDFFRKSCFHLEAGLPSKKNKIDEKRFFRLLKLGFSHKRKLLKNNLNPSTFNVDDIMKKCKIPPFSRAENLSLENWRCLYKNC